MRKKIQRDGTLEAMRDYIENTRAAELEKRQLEGRRGTFHEPALPEHTGLAITHPLRPPARDLSVRSASAILEQSHPVATRRSPGAANDAWSHPQAPPGRTFFVGGGSRRVHHRGPGASFDGFGSSPLPQDVNDPTFERAKLREWCERYGPASGLPVHVWATALAKEVDTVISPDVPRPHGLRAAVAMHVAKSAFKALHIPDIFWTDLVTTVYAGNSSHDPRAGELADEGWLNRVFSFQAMEQCKAFAIEMKQESDEAQARWRSVADEVLVRDEKARQDTLSLHFNAWRRLNRLAAWRWCAVATKEYAVGTKWVRRCFDAWRQCVRLSKTEAEVEELSSALTKLERDSREELRRTIEDKDLKAFNDRLRYDGELKEARRRQLTDEQLAANARTQERAKELEERVEEMGKVRQELELKLKDAGIFREQALQALNDAVLQVRRTFRSMLAGRTLDGIKASDLVVNAERALRGEMTEFRITSKEGSDIVTLPLQCLAEHLLLAFANYVVEVTTCSFPAIHAVGPPMADGMLYAMMVQHIFPRHPVLAATMLAEHDTTKRVEFFLAELDTVLVASSQTDSATKIQLGRFSPLQSAGITVADFLDGATECHAVILSYLLVCYARNHTINVVANMNYADFIMCEEEEQNGSQVAPVTNLQTARKMLDELTVALHLVKRSTVSWRLVTQHVEDQLLSQLTSMRREKSAAIVLRQAKDSRLAHFTLPSDEAIASLGDDGEEQAVVQEDGVMLEAVVNKSVAQSSASFTALGPVEEDSPEYLAYRALEDLIPHSQVRNMALRSVSKHLALIANIFSHYAKHKITMNILEFNAFSADVKCAEFLPPGETMDDVFKRHARYDRSKGVFGVEFVTLLLDIASMVAPRVAPIAHQANFLEAFLGHFVLYRNPHPIYFTAVADLMQTNRSLSLELITWRKMLKQLVAALAMHFSLQGQAPAALTKKKGGAPAPPQAPPAVATAVTAVPSLSFTDFARFCTDLDLIGAAVPAKELQLILDSAKRRLEEREAPPPVISETSFAEALVALSMYHFPSPFVSAGSKFRSFLVDLLLPRLRTKIPTVASTLPSC
jgi:hypothetical protein